MADLRVMMAELGYGAVQTLLNSGNVVFTVPPGSRADPAPRLERALLSRLGVKSRVTILTAAEVEEIVAKNPLHKVADNPSRLLVFVLTHPPDRAKLQSLTDQDWAPDALALGRRAAYLWCPAGIIDSRLATSVGKILGDAVTSRNWTTMTKLHALASQV